MTQKVAFIWGPVTSFNGPLAASLLKKGWHVHFACKSSLNLLSLSPLDLQTQAQNLIEQALGGKDLARAFKERLKLVEPGEGLKSTKYDAIIFGALPPNFDEARAPRAPWAPADFKSLSKYFKGVPVFVISSLWGGVQKDGVVPEELEFTRRKPLSNWEATCQQYEQRVLENFSGFETPWCLVRLPLITGSTTTGESLKYSGINSLLRAFCDRVAKPTFSKSTQTAGASLKLSYNPNSTLWFLPVDVAVNTFLHYIEDLNRPRICNLVSTQGILNREWLPQLAKAVENQDLICDESDNLTLPSTLRKLLLDQVQVKTRNLFEVAGRYKLLPTKIDQHYFDKIVKAGKAANFGENHIENLKLSQSKEENILEYSEQIAHYYFEKFIPEKIALGALKDAKLGDITIGFHLRSANVHGWILRSHAKTNISTNNGTDHATSQNSDEYEVGDNGSKHWQEGELTQDANERPTNAHGPVAAISAIFQNHTRTANRQTANLPTMSRFDVNQEKPDICFHFSGQTLSRLIQKKMLLHRALLMREVEVEGNMLQLLKIAGTIEKFLKEYPLTAKELPENSIEELN